MKESGDNSQMTILNIRKKALTFTKEDDKNKNDNLGIFKLNTTPEIKIIVVQDNNKKSAKKNKIKKSCFYLFLIVIREILFDQAFKYSDYENSKFERASQMNIYSQLERENKEIYLKIISDILNIDTAFNDAFYKGFIYSEYTANRENFILFIKNSIYWKKANKRFIIQCIILIAYFVLRIILFNLEYCCQEESIQNITNFGNTTNNTNYTNTTNYWNCGQDKCTVTKNYFNIINILRISYYIIYYILFLIYKGIYINTFSQKIKKMQANLVNFYL